MTLNTLCYFQSSGNTPQNSWLTSTCEYTDTTDINLAGITQNYSHGFIQDHASSLVKLIGEKFSFYPTGFFVNKMFQYEKEYGIPSTVFYRLYLEGHLETNKNFSEWAIIYKNIIENRKK